MIALLNVWLIINALQIFPRSSVVFLAFAVGKKDILSCLFDAVLHSITCVGVKLNCLLVTKNLNLESSFNFPNS